MAELKAVSARPRSSPRARPFRPGGPRLLAVGLVIGLGIESIAYANPIAFSDRAAAAGIGNLSFKTNGTWYAAGVAFVDLDGDGWPDLYFGAAAGESDQFCTNQRNGTFSCAPAGPPNKTDVLGLAAGDYDNDGDLDLYVMHQLPPNLLLQNDGLGHFTDVTAKTKSGGATNLYTTATGTFLDYDGDGKLDLYLGHWDGSSVIADAADQLLRQLPDGTFADVTHQAGIDEEDPEQGCCKSTLAMIAFDYDLDGRPDLFVSSDLDDPILFHNDGNGHYSDVTSRQPYDFPLSVHEGMGADSADIDGDGWPDLFVTGNHIPGVQKSASTLYLNHGDGTFVSRGDEYGVNTDFSWGTGLIDFDADGWPDIFVASNVADHYSVFHNLSGQAFEEIAIPGIEFGIKQCVTAAFADYDHDGRVDVILHSIDGNPPRLFHNDTGGTNHFLKVKIRPDGRDPVGTRVMVTTDRAQELEVRSESSKSSVNDRWLFFGLGAATVADVDAYFPDGRNVHVTGVAAGTELVLDRSGVAYDPPKPRGCNVTQAPGGDLSPYALLLSFLLITRKALTTGSPFRRRR